MYKGGDSQLNLVLAFISKGLKMIVYEVGKIGFCGSVRG
jgi:hypothetical protein